MKGILRRASTALIFVLVMIGGLFGGYYSFIFLFALITILCLWEFYDMTLDRGKRRDWLRRFLGTTFGLTPFVLASMIHLDHLRINENFVIASALLFFPLVFTIFIYELVAKSQTPFRNAAFIVLGMVYIGSPFALLDFIAFKGDYFYANTVFGLLVLTWINDTGAYLVGSFFGKTKLISRISPNKTIEGSLGGMALTLFTALGLSYFDAELSLVDWLVLGAIVAIFGSLGDLVQSMLKRSVGVKDSGNLLPGHGGVLDRFDAFIFLLPFAAAYLLWIR